MMTTLGPLFLCPRRVLIYVSRWNLKKRNQLENKSTEQMKALTTIILSDCVEFLFRTAYSVLRGGWRQWVLVSAVAGDPPQSLHLPAEPSPEAGGELWADREGLCMRSLHGAMSTCCMFHELSLSSCDCLLWIAASCSKGAVILLCLAHLHSLKGFTF